MEVHPGVFVSNVATQEWRADPEIGGCGGACPFRHRNHASRVVAVYSGG